MLKPMSTNEAKALIAWYVDRFIQPLSPTDANWIRHRHNLPGRKASKDKNFAVRTGRFAHVYFDFYWTADTVTIQPMRPVSAFHYGTIRKDSEGHLIFTSLPRSHLDMFKMDDSASYYEKQQEDR